MTRLGSRMVEADTLSDAWFETVELVLAADERKMFHTFTLIKDPTTEKPDLRAKCDQLLEDLDQASVETVAGTIFPKAMAESCASPRMLAQRYQEMYRTLQRFKGNEHGTYFGRLVAFPGATGPVDQLSRLIEKLRHESALRGPKAARYEVGIASPDDLAPAGAALDIHAPGTDNNAMGFPCLSACSFQLDHGKVHLLAHYRYEYLVERGYGNYLGLARLLQYVAASSGLETGLLSIVTGRAHVDASGKAIRRCLDPNLFDQVGS